MPSSIRLHSRRRTAPPPKLEPLSTVLARAFDRLADAELAAGHHATAERLAFRAAELREVAAG